MDFMKKAFPVLLFLLSLYIISLSLHNSTPIHDLQNSYIASSGGAKNCSGVHKFADYESKCEYVKLQGGCTGKGYLNYMEIFYCSCRNQPAVGYLVLLVWLVVLFYVVGNTTSVYFCPSVESLSKLLKLSPTIAGTTLLPLGNGANDVFSSVISFTRSGAGADVGLNSVLGGAFFICCFVVGIVSISISSREVSVDQGSFIRDVLFFLFVLCCLLTIIVFEQINFWFALCFVSLYLVYIALVSFMQLFCRAEEKRVAAGDEFGGVGIPLLNCADEENLSDKHQQDANNVGKSSCYCRILSFLELPLFLPRRLTIPDVSEGNWSKPYAVASAVLSPILLATVYTTQGQKIEFRSTLAIVLTSVLVGTILGTLAAIFTDKSAPPRSFLFPWLAGSFVMSIVWTYVLVEELVSLLVALGNILGTNPSILGFTVLAWGNSMGDLISNLTMAVKGGADGAQVAVSGCYAGPLFNTLVGLGLSLVFATWESYPSGFAIPGSRDLYETVGFLMVGLLWATVVLPKRNMQLDKSLGVGLLAIYFCFLFLRVVKSAGLLNLGGVR